MILVQNSIPKLKYQYIIMNPSLGFIQLLFYNPVLFIFLYIYLVIVIPKINAININSIYSQFISKLLRNKDNKFQQGP
jgi:hypothetical protein